MLLIRTLCNEVKNHDSSHRFSIQYQNNLETHAFGSALPFVIRERSPKTKMKTSTSFVREMSGTSLSCSSSCSRNLKP